MIDVVQVAETRWSVVDHGVSVSEHDARDEAIDAADRLARRRGCTLAVEGNPRTHRYELTTRP